MEQLKILHVEFLENYCMYISLSNGHGIMYDMKSKIKTARFQSLQSEDMYKKGNLFFDGTIRWKNDTELTLEEVIMEVTNQIPYRAQNTISIKRERTATE